MRRQSAILVLLITFCSLIMQSCIDAPSFESVPELSNPRVLLSSNPISGALGAQDTVKLLFDFTDGDGDIGYDNNQDTTQVIPAHVFLTLQEFDSTFTTFTLPVVPQNGGVPDISGTVTLTVLTSTGTYFGACSSNPQVNTITYSVYIKDRADNESNEINFETIQLDCP